MWLHEQLGAKDWKGKVHPRYAHAKHDGIRCTAYKQEDGSLLVFGKDHRPHLEMQARFPRLVEVLERSGWYALPPMTSIDMEVVTNGPASQVASALNGEAGTTLELVAFAIPYYAGSDMATRSMPHIEVLVNGCTNLKFAEYLELPAGECWDRDGLLALAAERGYEGWVLKDSNYTGWHKLKAVATVDCIVTAVKPGLGKFIGQVGALVVGVLRPDGTVREVANVSGMTDDQREQMSAADIGRVVEVAYQYVGAGGRLRHPRFKRWRDDKPWQDCNEEQLV